MIPEKLREVLGHEGVVAIATLGQDGPHLVNTWNSYVQITEAGRLLIPMGYMRRTEANIASNNQVLITMGSREVAGNMGPGTGFLIKGVASIETSGPDFDLVKAKFPWARAVMAVTASAIDQTL
ncbi:MAG: pyridoxamine 5'-phosphate oxidase family protein [Chlorobiaceae bacterium]|nr:pyridoxamine 5'-phosphate oxidase family protein [Chlorobiaceae bacterium]NTV25433.1 pyridoxamine 5'-phosphate oxidase family protein [Chlorobiaceae bacterium]